MWSVCVSACKCEFKFKLKPTLKTLLLSNNLCKSLVLSEVFGANAADVLEEPYLL